MYFFGLSLPWQLCLELVRVKSLNVCQFSCIYAADMHNKGKDVYDGVMS